MLTYTRVFDIVQAMTTTATRGPRSDAARNRDAILDAAIDLLGDDPRATLADIAVRAGIGRVTLYGHFSSREELIEAALIRTIDRAESELAELDLSGDPMKALERLVARSWRIVDTFHQLLGVAENALSNDRIREHHAEPLARVAHLVERGQAAGVMRTDLDAAWLTSCFSAILHNAAAELRAGRLSESEADRVATATVLSLMEPRP
jgi:TetR/AcrR family transcriptional repressor of mexCD-oprJ operon